MPRWFAWTFLALLSWGIWAILGKALGEELSPAQSQAVSTLGLIPVIVAIVMMRGVQHPGSALLGVAFAIGAGICSSVGNVPYYRLLSAGERAAVVVPLVSMSPLVTVALAVLLLRERMRVPQIVGIVAALAATYMFNVQSEAGILSRWLVAAAVPIFIWGLTGFLQKISTNHINAKQAALWFHLAFFPVAGAILWQQPLTDSLSNRVWLLNLALGFMLALGNFAIVLAFASGGKASIISPLAGLYPVISIPLAIWLFDERIDARETIAAVLALAAVALFAIEPAAPSNITEPSVETNA